MESKVEKYKTFDDILKDGEISEIMVNGPNQVFIEKGGKKILVDFKFKDDKELQELIFSFFKLAGRRIAPEVPYGDITLQETRQYFDHS